VCLGDKDKQQLGVRIRRALVAVSKQEDPAFCSNEAGAGGESLISRTVEAGERLPDFPKVFLSRTCTDRRFVCIATANTLPLHSRATTCTY